MDLNTRGKTKRCDVALKWKTWPSYLRRVVVENAGSELGFQKIALLKGHYTIFLSTELVLYWFGSFRHRQYVVFSFSYNNVGNGQFSWFLFA